MSKKSNFIKISDSLLENINYEDGYELIWILNILKVGKAYYTTWGDTKFLTTPATLINAIKIVEIPTRKIQQSLLTALEQLNEKGIISIEQDKLTWQSSIEIDFAKLIKVSHLAKNGEWFAIFMDELNILFSQPLKEIDNLAKAYFYIVSRLNMPNVDSLVEHEGEFTLYDFDQNDNFNFTFVSDTIDYMRCRKNYRIECDNNWIGKKQLSDTLKTLSDIGLIKSTTRSIANGCNKGLITKRNFYYLPIIEDWKMNKVIDRYVSRRNWTETNKNAPQS